MNRTKFIQKIFDERADTYDQWTKKFGIAYRNKIDEEVKKIILGMKQPPSILDMGCGSGSRLRNILENLSDPHFVVAGDLSWRMLKQASQNLSSLSVHCFQGKVEALPFASGRFDLVLLLYAVLGSVFPHSVRLQALKECHRVLKPGGFLILDILNRDYSFYRENPSIFEEAKIYYESQGWEWNQGDFLVEKEKGKVVMNHVFSEMELEELTSSLFAKSDWRCLNLETGEATHDREGHFLGILKK